jgi:hypothetical protein
MVSYKVVAPYVTLKVKDLSGTPVVQGFYAGAVVGDVVDEAQAKAQADAGLLEEFSVPTAEPEPPAAPVAVERPAGNASLEAWATYALESDQASEDEVKGLSRDELRELYG